MGLDLYLNRMPRYKNVTVNQIEVIESYFGWIEKRKEGNSYANCSFEEWCGHNINELPDTDALNYFKQLYVTRYSDWDKEKRYGHKDIMDEVGYWRKANQIHAWFVDHVQDGEDDCDYHHEVTKEILEELRDTCIEVLSESVMVVGQVKNGSSCTNGKWVDNYEPGKVIINPEVAKALLPTQSGFFFGGTDYDEYYVEDLKYTIDMINRVLATTDFNTQMLYYRSSR